MLNTRLDREPRRHQSNLLPHLDKHIICLVITNTLAAESAQLAVGRISTVNGTIMGFLMLSLNALKLFCSLHLCSLHLCRCTSAGVGFVSSVLRLTLLRSLGCTFKFWFSNLWGLGCPFVRFSVEILDLVFLAKWMRKKVLLQSSPPSMETPCAKKEIPGRKILHPKPCLDRDICRRTKPSLVGYHPRYPGLDGAECRR